MLFYELLYLQVSAIFVVLAGGLYFMFESMGDTTTRTYTYEDNFFSLVVFTSVYLLAALAIAYTVESLFTEASYGQVWSLTQSYSLSFLVKSVLPHKQD